MTEPAPYETLVDRLVREARERGEFDHLPGHGEPIPGLDGAYDELWWVKRAVQREQLSWLPPALLLRRQADEILEHVHELPTEAVVRRTVAAYQERVREVVRLPPDGVAVVPRRLDVEDVVRVWRERRAALAAAAPAARPPAAEPRRRWWRRRRRGVDNRTPPG